MLLTTAALLLTSGTKLVDQTSVSYHSPRTTLPADASLVVELESSLWEL